MNYADAIASIESGGNYGAIGPVTRTGNRAYGRYQVMDFNIGPWTQKHLGRQMTPDEFLKDQAAQDAVFNGEFGGYVSMYGNPQDAASAWFTGRPMAAAGNSSDGYTTAPEYVRRFTAALGGGQMNGTLSTSNAQPGLLGQAEQPRGLLGMRPDMLSKLGVAMMAASGYAPFQPLIAAKMGEMADARKERTDARKTNATVEYLRQINPQLASAVDAGVLSPSDAYKMGTGLASASNDPNVQSSSMLPDYSGSVITMRDGSIKVVTAGNEVLSGQSAMEFVAKAQQAYQDQQRGVYSSRQGGTLDAQIEQGGAAKAAETAGGETVKRAFDAYDQAMKASGGLTAIDDAIAAIDAGADSGMVAQYIPSVTEASASLDNAMNRMGLTVIQSTTFGALSEAEMRLAMETAVPRNLSPENLKSWLVKKRDAQVRARDALFAAARYLSDPGNTIAGWMEQQNKGQSGGQSGGTVIKYDAQGNRLQ